MFVIGLTGGIASGKSTVSAYLRTKGIPVFDADVEAAKVVAKGSAALSKIVEIFGTKALLPTGEMDRKWVGKEAFAQPEKLAALNALIHSQVDARRAQFISQNNQEKIVVLDVALLIECNWYKKVDQVWLVAVAEEVQIKRAMARSKMSRAEVVARIAAQMPLQDKKHYAQVIINNNDSLAETRAQVDAALDKLNRELR